MENSLARTEASQTRLNHRFTKFAHTFSNLTIEDLQLANIKRRFDQDSKLEGLLAVTACHNIGRLLYALQWKTRWVANKISLGLIEVFLWLTQATTMTEIGKSRFCKGKSVWLKMIIWLTGVLTRTVVGNGSFDNLCGSHLQSQVKMASEQVPHTSVANNRPCQDSSHPDDYFQ